MWPPQYVKLPTLILTALVTCEIIALWRLISMVRSLTWSRLSSSPIFFARGLADMLCGTVLWTRDKQKTNWQQADAQQNYYRGPALAAPIFSKTTDPKLGPRSHDFFLVEHPRPHFNAANNSRAMQAKDFSQKKKEEYFLSLCGEIKQASVVSPTAVTLYFNKSF